MIFWILVILMVLGIALIVLYIIADQNSCAGYTGILDYFDYEWIAFVGGIISVITGVTMIIALSIICMNNITAQATKAQYDQRYNALMYKSQTESIRDEFGIVNKEYIDEVQAWNEELAKMKVYQRDFWIGIFYPNIYDDFELIELYNIRMRE